MPSGNPYRPKRAKYQKSCRGKVCDSGMTGEPCALKGASTVRRGAHRNLGWKQFKALGAYPTKQPPPSTLLRTWLLQAVKCCSLIWIHSPIRAVALEPLRISEHIPFTTCSFNKMMS